MQYILVAGRWLKASSCHKHNFQVHSHIHKSTINKQRKIRSTSTAVNSSSFRPNHNYNLLQRHISPHITLHTIFFYHESQNTDSSPSVHELRRGEHFTIYILVLCSLLLLHFGQLRQQLLASCGNTRVKSGRLL